MPAALTPSDAAELAAELRDLADYRAFLEELDEEDFLSALEEEFEDG